MQGPHTLVIQVSKITFSSWRILVSKMPQIIETGLAEQFYASRRMGLASICLKITARIAYSLKQELLNGLSHPPLFSMVNPFKASFDIVM
jgi:hypothetical protein